MSQFSSDAIASIEKKIDRPIALVRTKPEDIEHVYEITRCSEWITKNDFKKVCLQFPDQLLPDSSEVALRLQNLLKQTIYIMSDTVYESCCIDYIAAAHVQADAIIHFGPTCFSKTESLLPHLNIYEKGQILIEDFYECFRKRFADVTENIVVLLDTPYIYLLDAFIETTIDSNALIWPIDHENLDLSQHITLFVGENIRKLTNVKFSLKPKKLFYYDPKNKTEIELYETNTKLLKRRNFLAEKVKDANTIGIIIGTLAVKNYLSIIERMKKIIKLHNKKYYTISVGKPTVAKLANFPEIDIYVIIGCAMNDVYENRDFFKPIVTPYDIEYALNPKHNASFAYDFNTFLSEDDPNVENIEIRENDVSLVTGKVRTKAGLDTASESNQLSLKSDGTLAVNTSFGAGYLSERTWKGLEQNLGENEASAVTEGRLGTARSYKNEVS